MSKDVIIRFGGWVWKAAPSNHPSIQPSIQPFEPLISCPSVREGQAEQLEWPKFPSGRIPRTPRAAWKLNPFVVSLGLLQAGLWHSSNFIFNQLTCKDYENKIWRWKTSCSPFHFAAMLLFCLGIINPDHPCPLQMGDFTLSCRAVTCVKYPSKRQELEQAN